MSKKTITTARAPRAIGAYSQAVRAGDTVYLSGQIPLHPETMQLVEGDIRSQAHRVFANLEAVAAAAGGSLGDVVKLSVYLADIRDFPIINEVMSEYFDEPYPARAALGVAALPKGAGVEIEAIMHLA